ncbi:hypothetical protein FJQ98_14125 [Lysinibacillus agricola]|uniref:Phage protein n=1 Tax=Lysinibacillus agricola TaxID=2590012 RepID=A0ABX7AKT7_9BACI|nr:MULTISPECIES: hypothetical protein [Lysinibacillus]KOS64630.1 hypothetical protein AN161_00985 [Lysinibacillus sp. FJAT-14222]QQP10425.1 hypothetical protein FJQ98_14125 [Lysinibacillus agricola]
MNIVEMRRKHTKWNIEQNPTTININRTIKKKSQGYIDDKNIDVGPFMVRIFNSGSSSPQVVTTLAGEKQTDTYFGILADFEADIQASTIVKDEFEVEGICFLVKSIYPQRINGEVVGYQGELERVT